MPFLYVKTMPDLEVHALSMYKNYAWHKKSCPFPTNHPEDRVKSNKHFGLSEKMNKNETIG